MTELARHRVLNLRNIVFLVLVVAIAWFLLSGGSIILGVGGAYSPFYLPDFFRINLSWMAWTWPTAAFFITIAALIAGMAAWEVASPGGSPRIGVLRFETTRGDRLFISLLGSAFIHLAWLGLVGPNLWWALALSVVYAIGVFRYV